jgi:Transposase IS66 family
MRASCTRHGRRAAHLLRELTAVTETGSKLDVIWAKQAIDVLLKLKDAAAAARDAGHARIDPALLAGQERYFADAAQTGIVLNAARRSSLEKKRHALANRMRDRVGDYLRFAYDLRVPFDNYPDVAVCRSPGRAGVFPLAGAVAWPRSSRSPRPAAGQRGRPGWPGSPGIPSAPAPS